MSQMRKNLKVVAIACLVIGLVFGVLAIISCITFVGTTATGSNGAIPEEFVDVSTGTIGAVPMLSAFIKAGECILGFWGGWAGVQAGNVPSKGRTALIACIVGCCGFLAASAYFWFIDGGVDTVSLVFSLMGALATLAGVAFSRAVWNEALDALE